MNENIERIAQEAVKIYFDYSVSAEEAIKKAKEMIENEKKMDKMEKIN